MPTVDLDRSSRRQSQSNAMADKPRRRRGHFGLGVLALLIALFFGLADEGQAQSSPFQVPTPDTTTSAPSNAPTSMLRTEASAWTRFWAWIQTTQQNLHRSLAKAVRNLKNEGSLAAGWVLASLSFLYGIVHAAGPGHGKAVISSYVIANERTVRRGIILSFLAAGVQALTAVVIVGVLAVILNAAGLRIRALATWMETASYALIAIVGAWLLFSQLRRAIVPKSSSHSHDHHHDHDHRHGHDHGHHHDHDGDACCNHGHMPLPDQLEGDLDIKKAAAIVLAVGIRPCTGALIVLVFALAQGIFLAGVGATFAMALGTAITVSALATLAVGSKAVALRLAGGQGVWANRISLAAGIGGSAFVLLLGAMLFYGSLGPARPF